jgi:LDH2 family malate/lactate/ureidoglycolate dehydrogenase
MMVEILCALLAGMPLDHELSHLFSVPYDEPRRIAHLFLAFDVGAFREPRGFQEDLSRLMTVVRSQPAAGQEPVVVPGDLESRAATDRLAQGIPLEEDEWRRWESAVRPPGR